MLATDTKANALANSGEQGGVTTQILCRPWLAKARQTSIVVASILFIGVRSLFGVPRRRRQKGCPGPDGGGPSPPLEHDTAVVGVPLRRAIAAPHQPRVVPVAARPLRLCPRGGLETTTIATTTTTTTTTTITYYCYCFCDNNNY